MTTPIMPDGDKSVGPNACPTFEYDADASLASVLSSIEATLSPQAPRSAAAGAPHALSAEKRQLLEKLRTKFQELNDRSQKAGLGF